MLSPTDFVRGTHFGGVHLTRFVEVSMKGGTSYDVCQMGYHRVCYVSRSV